LSSGQASYVLDRLVADRRISAGEISRYVADMHREISSLEERLNSLRSAAGAPSAPAAAPKRRPGRPPGSGAAAAAAGGTRKRRRGRPPASAAAPATSGGDAAPAAAGGAKRGRKRRTAITAEQLASRQLQGRYLGLIRQIPANRRGPYQKIAKEQGREQAIKEIAKALGK
jgi:hypothetical protein